MMNRLQKIFFFFFVLTSLTTFSQNDILDTIAKETCDCIAKKSIDLNNSDDNELTVQLGFCMLESYSQHKSEFKDDAVLNMSDSKQMREFGQDIGLKMMQFCPDIIMKIGKNELNKENGGVVDEEYVEEELIIIGNVKSISQKNYYTIKVVESTGRNYEIILLNSFDNAYLLIDNLIKTNDRVEINYYEVDLYDAKSNKFITQKIISDIKKI